MKTKINFAYSAFFIILICSTFIIHSCKKEAEKPTPKPPTIVLPTVSTITPTNVTQTSAQSGGNISSSGNGEITSKGVVWSTNQSPTTSNNLGKTIDGSGTNSFISSLAGLSANTTYYVRAYATNSAGTGYGSEQTFQTPPEIVVLPTVTTTIPSNVSQTSASSGGNVTSAGNGTVTARGVVWSTSQNPTTANSKTTDGNGIGSFTSNLTGLNPNTTYYVRAYATNSAGTGYGSQYSFTTPPNPIDPPTVSTTAPSNVGTTTATSGGNVSNDGGASVTARGVVWSTSQNPTISNSKTTNGSGTGSFTSSITGLNPNTTYYVRAYATNSAGPGYGSQHSFQTPPDQIIPPTVITTTPLNVTTTSAISGGNVTSAGNGTVTVRGVVWSTSPGPTTANSKTTDGSGMGSFTSSLTGLTANTTYYVRAYATNSAGNGYGSEQTFHTPPPPVVLPTVITIPATNITSTGAMSGGNVTSAGNGTVTARGVVWSTSLNPTTQSYLGRTTNGTGIGSYTSNISGLNPNTHYYVRAYATNLAGTVYGTNESFTTLPENEGRFTDSRDGKSYDWVRIGSDIWMADNLNYHTSGAVGVSPNTGWLYTWATAVNSCPSGWHLPSRGDVNDLVTNLGGENVAGGKMKETGTSHWNPPNTGATNSSKFTALPEGMYVDGFLIERGKYANFWINYTASNGEGRIFYLCYDNAGIWEYYEPKSKMLSVRCVKDN